MKKTIAIIALIATAFVTKAQNIEIKTNPFGMAAGAYNITGEFALPNYGNRTLLVSAWYNTQDFQEWLDTDRDGGFSLGYRQYFNRHEDNGAFLGLTSRYIINTYYSAGFYDQNYNWINTPGTDVSDDYLSIGFVGGYKYVYNDKISVEAFLGMGRIAFTENENSSWAPAEFIGGFNFGYRF
ncbi:MAG: DUF3575 domain-containing protein [Flavobacteriales bacterium]|nr:DUF3575 domain-containing protein [Flavobacteriales bacterium]